MSFVQKIEIYRAGDLKLDKKVLGTNLVNTTECLEKLVVDWRRVVFSPLTESSFRSRTRMANIPWNFNRQTENRTASNKSVNNCDNFAKC